MKRIKRWIRAIARKITWQWTISRTGLLGLIYMLFNPSSASPSMVVVFAAMIGLKPMSDFDRIISKDPKKENKDA